MSDGPEADDRHDQREEPDLDQGRDQHIRALLAELGSGPDGEPMPAEVAARLEGTLARLVAERAAGEDTEVDPEHEAEQDPDRSATVLPLRRRWLPRATAAAAAIVVLGAGGVAAANLGLLGAGSSTSKSSAGGGTVADSAPEATTTPATPGAESLSDSLTDKAARSAAALPEVSANSFASDVASLLARRNALVRPNETPAPAGTADKSAGSGNEAKQGATSSLKSLGCPGPAITDDAVPTPVRYDGQLAVLVVHPERDGHRLVEAWDCAGDRLLAGTTLTP